MSKITFKIDEDFTMLRRIEKSVKQLNARHIRWGWLDNVKYPSDKGKSFTTTAQVAFWAEYGTIKQPARPYFRQAINKSRYSYNDKIKDIFQRTLLTGVDETGLSILASNLVADYNESVLKQNYAKLSDYTVELKGHRYQMDDTGLLLESFKSKVYKQSINSVKENQTQITRSK